MIILPRQRNSLAELVSALEPGVDTYMSGRARAKNQRQLAADLEGMGYSREKAQALSRMTEKQQALFGKPENMAPAAMRATAQQYGDAGAEQSPLRQASLAQSPMQQETIGEQAQPTERPSLAKNLIALAEKQGQDLLARHMQQPQQEQPQQPQTQASIQGLLQSLGVAPQQQGLPQFQAMLKGPQSPVGIESLLQSLMQPQQTSPELEQLRAPLRQDFLQDKLSPGSYNELMRSEQPQTQGQQPQQIPQPETQKRPEKRNVFNQATEMRKDALKYAATGDHAQQKFADALNTQADAIEKKAHAAFKAHEKFIEKIDDTTDNAFSQLQTIEQMAKLDVGDALGTQGNAVFAGMLDRVLGEGAGNLVLTGDAQMFNKHKAQFLAGLKGEFGGRITTIELENFMKKFPSLTNSKEGREKIYEFFRLGTEFKALEAQAKDDLIRENGGYPPEDFRTAWRKRSAELRKQFVNENTAKLRSVVGAPAEKTPEVNVDFVQLGLPSPAKAQPNKKYQKPGGPAYYVKDGRWSIYNG